MQEFVYIDGELYPAGEARISVFDHGFLYGDGLFETMRAYKGRVFLMAEHLRRLSESADMLEIKMPMDIDSLGRAIVATLKANRLTDKDAYIRLSLTRGRGAIGIDPGLCGAASVIIMTRPLSLRKDMYRKGISAVVVNTRRNSIGALDPRIKSMNFLNNILAKMEVKKAGADDGIMLNQKGEVAESTVGNIFAVDGNGLITPPVAAGILPGITRQKVLEIASVKMPVAERALYPEDLYNAREVFLTGSVSEIVPVTSIDGRLIGSGKPGQVTKKLHQIYSSLTCL